MFHALNSLHVCLPVRQDRVNSNITHFVFSILGTGITRQDRLGISVLGLVDVNILWG